MKTLGNFALFFSILFITIPSWSQPGWEPFFDETVVRFGEFGSGTCTGTRISHQGHILTARHCFDACLISGGFTEKTPLFPEFGWQSPQLYRQNKVATCSTLINGEKAEIEILASSPGFMIPIEQASLSQMDKTIHQSFLDQAFLHNGDFAIVREKTPIHTSCRKVSQKPLTSGEFVEFRGFPIASTGRPEGRNSSGKELLRGEGVVVSSILENSCISANTPFKEQLVNSYDREDIILSSLDVLPGASGSSLLNSQGEITGVINSIFRFKIDVLSTYCSGSAVAVPIASIVHHLKKQVGLKSVQEFFSCTETFTPKLF